MNLLSARMFGGHGHDLNRRAAMVHLLTDAAVSAAVLVAAIGADHARRGAGGDRCAPRARVGDDLALLHGAKGVLARLGIAHSTLQLEPPPE